MPQVEAACAAHSLSGSTPDGMLLHVPSCPVWLHWAQTPAQRVLQQTPSVQKLLAHSASLVQVWPGKSLQVPPAQL